jgi:hypothetical protein
LNHRSRFSALLRRPSETGGCDDFGFCPFDGFFDGLIECKQPLGDGFSILGRKLLESGHGTGRWLSRVPEQMINQKGFGQSPIFGQSH